MTARIHPFSQPVAWPFPRKDAESNTLVRQHLKADPKRFDENASVTGYGDLGVECALPARESVHVTSARQRAAQIIHDDRGATEQGRHVRDLIDGREFGGRFNHHDFAIVILALESQLERVRGWDYSRVLDHLEEAWEGMRGVESIREDEPR